MAVLTPAATYCICFCLVIVCDQIGIPCFSVIQPGSHNCSCQLLTYKKHFKILLRCPAFLLSLENTEDLLWTCWSLKAKHLQSSGSHHLPHTHYSEERLLEVKGLASQSSWPLYYWTKGKMNVWTGNNNILIIPPSALCKTMAYA